MTVYDRFKMELSNQEYFSEEEYKQFLIEQDLDSSAEYDKNTMCKQLYLACIDVLEAVANDVDIMTSVSTEFADIAQAYEFIEARITKLRDKIASLPSEDEEYSSFSMMFTKPHRRSFVPYKEDNHAITKEQINEMIGE